MVNIIAHEVFREIIDISRSKAPPAGRRIEAERRVVLFKADLARAGNPPGVTGSIEGDLRRHLEDALDNHELDGDELSVFLAALDMLTGPED